jgi:hypothetical protein
MYKYALICIMPQHLYETLQNLAHLLLVLPTWHFLLCEHAHGNFSLKNLKQTKYRTK